MDEEFERQDAKRKVCGQRSPAEYDVVGQSAAAPSCQDWLCQLLDALGDGIAIGRGGFYTRSSAEAGDGVDDVVDEGLYVEVGTGRATVEAVGVDRLDDFGYHDQCLFGTGEFVHRLS